jgi:6-phosphogluconolactonase
MFVAVLVALLVPGCGILSADETTKPRFLLAWGKKGDRAGEFYSPIGIAINKKDEVYVTDLNNARLQKFASNGKYLGGFDLPRDDPKRKSSQAGGIAVDDQGLIYVTFMMQDKVRVYTDAGKIIREWGKHGRGDGELFAPGGIVLAPDGTVYVADQRNHRVQRFTAQGVFLGKWGEHGKKPGQFDGVEPVGSRFGGPHFLGLDSKGRLYTTEGALGRVQQFSAEGKPLLAWGDKGTQPGGFGALKTGYAKNTFGPIAILVDKHDRVWVSSLNDRVQLFSPEGRFLVGIGSSGKEPGQFARPHGMALDSKGHLYVADAGNQRIQKFEIPEPAKALADTSVFVSVAGAKKITVYEMHRKKGTLTLSAVVPIDGEPGALTVDPKRQFLFASIRSEGKLASFRIDRQSGKLTHINTVAAGADPAQISTDRQGRFLFCAYYVAGKITVHFIGKDGALSRKPVQEIATADKAHAILPDPANRFVFVAHTGPNAIFQFAFDAKTGELKPATIAKLRTPANTGPRHIVWHPSKAIAYIDNEQASSVTAYSLDSKTGTLKPLQTVTTLPANFKGTNACAEIRIHPSGKYLYVANRGHDSIACYKVDPKDGKLTGTGQALTEKTPRSFDLDPEGRFLYVAGENSGKLAGYRIKKDTGMLERFVSYKAGKQPWWVMAVKLP